MQAILTFTRRVAASLAALLLLSIAPAWADPALSILQQTGLLGTWAGNCGATASKDNPYVIYYQTDKGTVRRRLDRGMDWAALDGAVDNAQRLTKTTLRMTMRNDDPSWDDQNGMTFETVVEVMGNRARSLSSTSGDGMVFIKDGIFTSNGNPVPYLRHCPG